jgi:hypothetical protein
MRVAALADAWGDDALKAFLTQLKANGCRIASSNGEVKRLVASGEVAFGLADTDDAAEALRDGAPIEVVYPDQDGMGTLLMPTAVVPLARRYSTRAGSSTWAASTTSGPGPTSPSRGASSRHLTDARDLPHLLDVGEGSAMETHRIPACNVSSALRQRTPLRCRASHADRAFTATVPSGAPFPVNSCCCGPVMAGTVRRVGKSGQVWVRTPAPARQRKPVTGRRRRRARTSVAATPDEDVPAAVDTPRLA